MNTNTGHTNNNSNSNNSNNSSNHHKLAKDIVTNSGNDIDDMILKSGCSNEYYKLEECLCDNDRKWSKCQQQVSLLQKCNTNKQNKAT